MSTSISYPLGYSIVNPAVTAAGTTQATATQLNAFTSIVSTVPSGAGVQILPAGQLVQTIINTSANPLNVWPQPGMSIGTAAANTAVTIAPGASIGIAVVSPTQAEVVTGSGANVISPVVYTAAGAISTADVYSLINSATAITMTLAAGPNGVKHTICNYGAGAVTLTMPYMGATSYSLASGAAIAVIYNTALSTYLLAP